MNQIVYRVDTKHNNVNIEIANSKLKQTDNAQLNLRLCNFPNSLNISPNLYNIATAKNK